ncbi:MAG: haloacid dehalogenase [SAR86 cluster bacterium]|uniref:Haloacid dehalogenase n=1 Tax=SAR86 cluster bacterium TaxID=2030880 RepID=A0A2A5B9Y2_9GAMM|nr:MAG: haloacid dehalogenase [SAR86 cluster bacterium]
MPPWADIDTIMFDMDGTLLDLHFDTYFWQVLVPKIYSQTHGVSTGAARQIIIDKYSEVRGTLNWYCLDYWERELKLEIANLKATIKHKIKIRPNVEKILQTLKLSNKRLLLITNAHPSSLKIKMEHTGIGDYFHQCISSHHLKLAKENHGFWESLQQLEPYDPERTILFDDSLPVLRQAQAEGIRHLYAIKQPDSQQPSLEAAEFPQVDDFDHIMPDRNNSNN